MNTAALATLAAILEHGSFAAAAEVVGRTPSAVSLQIKQLEAYFGQPLFDRSARSARPTPFAQEAGALAREVLGRLEGLRARRALAIAGRVRLGAIATIQSDTLPQVLRLVRDRHPALDVDVLLEDSDALIAGVQGGRIDAAALIRPASGGSSRLQWQDLCRQPFVMLVPDDAPAASPQALLHRFGWIRYDTALTGGRLAARHVKRLLPHARSTMEVRAIDVIVAMVAARLGVSVVPLPRTELLHAQGVRTVPLGRAGPTRQIAFVRRKQDTADRNIDALHRAFASVYASRLTDRAPR